MPKTNYSVTWAGATSGSAGPGGWAYSDAMSIDTAAYDGRIDISIDGAGGGTETGYYINLYAQYSADNTNYEAAPDSRRLFPLGSIYVEDTTWPKVLPNAPLDTLPAGFKLVVYNGATTDTVSFSAVYRLLS